jgi:hypothetical protein
MGSSSTLILHRSGVVPWNKGKVVGQRAATGVEEERLEKE